MMKIYQSGTTLKVSVFDKLVGVFTELGWNIEEGGILSDFCKLLARLEPTEQQLVLEITRDFLHCDFIRYEATLRKIIPQLEAFFSEHIKEIIVVPLISPKDIGKSKSSSFLVYPLQEILRPIARVKNLQLSSVDRSSVLNDKHKTRKNALIIFVDDFLGSGQTAQEALEEY